MQNEELAKLLVERSYLVAPEGQPFVLASGKRSDRYFECQRTTLYAPAFPLVGRAFLRKFDELGLRPEAVGGLVLGADPITLAVVGASSARGEPDIQGFRVRKEPKTHGTGNWIEGCARPGAKVVVVEDVVTLGGSVCRAIEICRREGLEVIGCVALVDREEGGMQRVAQVLGDLPLGAIFTWSQLRPAIEHRHGRPTGS